MGYRVTYRQQINSFKYGTTDYIIIASRSRSGAGSVLQGTGRKGNMAVAQQPEMDNYLELEPFSKDGRLCAHVCDTLKSLPETPTLAAYKDYKAIIILLGMSTTRYAILDELAEQHRKRDEIPELTAYCDALHWMRPGRQYLCNVYNTVCHAFHLLRRNPVRDNRLLVTEKELRHAERMLPELGRQTFTEWCV